jgi:hypothetical protein
MLSVAKRTAPAVGAGVSSTASETLRFAQGDMSYIVSNSLITVFKSLSPLPDKFTKMT